MPGIAGIDLPGKQAEVDMMLDKIEHRGPADRTIIEVGGATLGIVSPESRVIPAEELEKERAVWDDAGDGHSARAEVTPNGLMLTRDELGVAPLYHGSTEDGVTCFASEVKALLPLTQEVHEVPPGHRCDGERITCYFSLKKQTPLDESPERVAKDLRELLEASVEKRVGDAEVGSWLSGGLDSSAMAALARKHMDELHTFAAGIPGAPDVEHAREVAEFIGSNHHEVIVTLDDMLAALPKVIYHLESFDALLVRSSITNYLVAGLASEYVDEVFSGEGGDELFAGYEYIKALDPALLPDELIDITNRLHNTALQRVDRSASAHGTVAHVGILDPDVVDYALRIPVEYKLRDGVEKWIFRQAMDGELPERVLNRKKAKFWEGAGVGEQLAGYANEHISDADFARERTLPNGWTINTKEELMYYRIFREHFGELEDLSWMGRTKGAPRQ